MISQPQQPKGCAVHKYGGGSFGVYVKGTDRILQPHCPLCWQNGVSSNFLEDDYWRKVEYAEAYLSTILDKFLDLHQALKQQFASVLLSFKQLIANPQEANQIPVSDGPLSQPLKYFFCDKPSFITTQLLKGFNSQTFRNTQEQYIKMRMAKATNRKMKFMKPVKPIGQSINPQRQPNISESTSIPNFWRQSTADMSKSAIFPEETAANQSRFVGKSPITVRAANSRKDASNAINNGLISQYGFGNSIRTVQTQPQQQSRARQTLPQSTTQPRFPNVNPARTSTGTTLYHSRQN